MVRNPENWRWLTPIFGVLNFLGMLAITVVGFFLVRTVDQFDRHMERLDTKFEEQTKTNSKFDHDIALIEGRCCNRGVIQKFDGG